MEVLGNEYRLQLFKKIIEAIKFHPDFDVSKNSIVVTSKGFIKVPVFVTIKKLEGLPKEDQVELTNKFCRINAVLESGEFNNVEYVIIGGRNNNRKYLGFLLSFPGPKELEEYMEFLKVVKGLK
jgi:hypothetical protein